MDEFKTGLPPSVHPQTRVLILGSLPGERSLSMQEYYAHPSNAFWWLAGELLEEELVGLPYTKRLELLGTHHVGLWDVIASGRRSGSLDVAIRDAVPRNILAFSEALPELRAIAFNGTTASRLGRRQLAGSEDRWNLIDLPSSSAANAGVTRSAKLAQWRAISPYLLSP
ncbi:MAG: DNA-deoxyinosine glycosylase [Verrucomicrobiaceae bacterium]|nr:MAG: DNA-deoxyinosine glycosylase [Verrucomicrobiaceae bacterium]